ETEGPSGIDARPSWVKPASRLHVTRAEQDLPGKHKPVRCADRTSACVRGPSEKERRRESGPRSRRAVAVTQRPGAMKLGPCGVALALSPEQRDFAHENGVLTQRVYIARSFFTRCSGVIFGGARSRVPH